MAWRYLIEIENIFKDNQRVTTPKKMVERQNILGDDEWECYHIFEYTSANKVEFASFYKKWVVEP